MNVGVLALQGSVEEHLNILNSINRVKGLAVRKKEEIENVDALIMPGGESTTYAKLFEYFDIADTLKRRIKEGMPVWGTCAGMILLAKEIEGARPHLGLMDITVRRNAYGRQLDSFFTEGDFEGVGYIGMVFIRAPKITAYAPTVTPLAYHKEEVVAARQDNMLVTAFHPEMIPTDDRVHRYFCKMV